MYKAKTAQDGDDHQRVNTEPIQHFITLSGSSLSTLTAGKLCQETRVKNVLNHTITIFFAMGSSKFSYQRWLRRRRRRGGRSKMRSLLIDAGEAILEYRCASRASVRLLRIMDRPPRRFAAPLLI